MKLASRGYLYTLEVLVAVTIITASIAFVFKFPQQKPETELSEIMRQGRNAIEYMDSVGILRDYVYQNNETAIEYELAAVLSGGIGFETEICENDCSPAGTPSNHTIVVTDYYLAGHGKNYEFKKVRLYLWKS